MKWVGFPIRLLLWLLTILIFWPPCALALVLFNPQAITWEAWLSAQKSTYKEFVLGEL